MKNEETHTLPDLKELNPLAPQTLRECDDMIYDLDIIIVSIQDQIERISSSGEDDQVWVHRAKRALASAKAKRDRVQALRTEYKRDWLMTYNHANTLASVIRRAGDNAEWDDETQEVVLSQRAWGEIEIALEKIVQREPS